MVKELYSINTVKTTLSVMNTKITAIQKSNTTKTGLRLYDNGYIGVAGAIGAFDEAKLTEHAKQMLNFKIPYDCEPVKNVKRTEDFAKDFKITVPEFVEKSENLLKMLKSDYPEFSFSHKIILEEMVIHLRNDLGADLIQKDKLVQIVLLIKHNKSKNLMDSGGFYYSRDFDLDTAYKAIVESCECYDNKVSVPEGKMPVVFLFDSEMLLGKFFDDLNGRAMGTDASMFAGKIGEKLFNESFSLYVDRNPHDFQSFFDAEGTVLTDDKFALIENGVFMSPYSSKKIAKEYGYAATGSGGGDYDSVPNLSEAGISIKSSGKSINELLNGQKAIYVVLASGGDFTAQGEYASPIQAAFLWEDGKLTGRLPQMAMSSHIYDMFGQDFIGKATDGNTLNSPMKYLAMNMNVSTIGDWI